ncbi:MAG: hypothetical protein SGBAC_010045 [Bacillariaceae sp.]
MVEPAMSGIKEPMRVSVETASNNSSRFGNEEKTSCRSSTGSPDCSSSIEHGSFASPLPTQRKQGGLPLSDIVGTQGSATNKLRFDAVGMVGREAEFETIMSSYNRMLKRNEKHCTKELLFIKGTSGIGKSMLTASFIPYVRQNNGFFIRGKFDMHKRDEPYSGIANAFANLCRAVRDEALSKESKSEDSEDCTRMRNAGDAIVSEFGSEVALLEQLIPELPMILPPIERHDRLIVENFDYEAGQERWKYLFQVLTRILSTHFSPLVIFIEDLHWADTASLELIDLLMTDSSNSAPLMVIGNYRSNEVNETHRLFTTMKKLTQKQERWQFNVSEIELGNLQYEDVNTIIKQLLSIRNGYETRRLTEMCLQRTLGNPFFIMEFMTMLVQENLITFHDRLQKWGWDDDVIESETISTDTVVNLMYLRMKRLPADVQLALQCAACLGSSFNLTTLNHIWTKLGVADGDSAPEHILSLLTVLEENKFIENSGTNEYRLVHDRVREVALSYGRAAEDSFEFEVGTALYHSLDDGLEDLLFEVTNLINKGKRKRKLEFAQLNLRAAEKARQISALHASSYVACGIGFLPIDAWTTHRCLTLRLHSIGAEMELAVGRIDAMETYINAVLPRDDCTVIDKFPLHMSNVYKLCTVDLKYKDTIDYCLSVLKDLDCKISDNKVLLPIQAIASLMKTIKMAKKRSLEDYKTLKPMHDPKHQATMLLAQRMTIACYLLPSTSNGMLLIQALARMVQITLKHGVGTLSGAAFATLGLLAVAVNGDFESASYFCEVALLLQQRTSSKYTSSITLFNAHASVLAWVIPLDDCLMPISQAYTHGRQSGNTEQAMWALQVHNVWMPYQMGNSLDSILNECSDVAAQSAEVKQNEQITFLSIFWQLMLNLAGSSDCTTTLKGEVFDCENFESNTDLQDALYHLAQLELYIFFGDFEAAAALALNRKDKYEKAAPGFFLGMMETFHRGVALYVMAEKTKKRQYKKAAKTILKAVTKWEASGNPNVKHYQLFLLAAQCVLDRKLDEAEANYKKALVFAEQEERLHDAALFAERYSYFLETSRGDKQGAALKMDQAISFYQEWGAKAKVQMLKR